jgi:tetratricopeptide (TPR) repeat protein
MTQPEDAETMSADIRHKRGALDACPKGHRDRVQLAAALGEVLRTGYRNIRDINLVKEGIEVEREVLALRPRGHPDRALSCSNLGFSLHECYEQAGDVTLLDEAIKLKRKALTLRPPGHLHRALTCANLGTSLYARYQRCGDLAMLDEAIVLEREALSLRPPGHPLRAFSCNNLANSLHVCYSQCGDITLFDEAIELDREALVLRPPGHPDRAISCTNLATSLHARYEQCGDVTLFNEAIDLDHEALALRPPDHPDRAVSCNNLATSLHMRYKQCGALTLLDESIKFKREALALQPPGHPERAASCANLGASLYARYQRCDDLILLDEAIKHQREALALRSPCHPLRAVSCNDLANSLHVRYEQCDDLALFIEAIELNREALVLRPPGHPQQSLNPLHSLIELYKRTKDVALLDEVIALCDHALKSGDALEASRSFAILSGIYSIPGTPYFSTVKALRCLHVSFGRNVDSIHDFIRSTHYSLSQFWSLSGSIWTPETRQLLCEIYVKIIDQLPLAAGFVLDTQSRLQTLKSTHRIGTDACMAAVLAGQPTTAVELLDRAHGLVWMQALHQRDPQMKGAPPALASELAGHLHAMAAPAAQLEEPLHRHQDDRHRRSTRAHALLREIRAKPGLERFMLGITYETLRAAARSHAVVVLAAGRGHAFALIMSSATEYHPHALHLDLTSDDLQLLQSAVQDAGLRSRADTREGGGLDARIGYKTSGLHVHHKPFRVLAKIWHKIVKPVIDYLQLEVCILMAPCRVVSTDEHDTENYRPVTTSSALVYQRRLRLPPAARGRHLPGSRIRSGVLFGLCRLVVHADGLSAAPRSSSGCVSHIRPSRHVACGRGLR